MRRGGGGKNGQPSLKTGGRGEHFIGLASRIRAAIRAQKNKAKEIWRDGAGKDQRASKTCAWSQPGEENGAHIASRKFI